MPVVNEKGTKVCTKCGVEKDKSEFYSDKQKGDGLSSSCKVCKKGQNNEYAARPENKDRKRKYDEKYRKTDAGIAVEMRSREKHKTLLRTDPEYKKEYNAKRKEYFSQPDKIQRRRDRQKSYRDKTPNEKMAKQLREYRQRNREKHNAWARDYWRKNKYKFAWRQILSDTHRRMGTKKSDRTVKELGYSADQLKSHLESLFVEGMSWDNHGEWHIDHIKPVSSFKKGTSPSVVNALSNLQPLWASDNISKGCR